MKFFLNILLYASISVLIYYSYIWSQNDNTGEAVFALISTLLIPTILFIQNRQWKNSNYNVSVESFDWKIDERIDIEYPIISLPSNTFIESRLNQTIEYCYLKYGVDIIAREYHEDIGYFESSFEHAYTIDNLFGLTFVVSRYFDGAAHPNTDYITMNFDLRTGGVFEYKDLFKSKYFDDIVDLVKKSLIDNEECSESYFDLNKIVIRNDQEFYINIQEKSLILVFMKYEIAPGMCGFIEAELNFEDIEKYVNFSGPLSFLGKPIYDDVFLEKSTADDFFLKRVEEFS